MGTVTEMKKPRTRQAAGLSKADLLGNGIDTKSIEARRLAQPIHYDGLFRGWIIDRQSGQFEAALGLGDSLGMFNNAQAALNALILASRHG